MRCRGDKPQSYVLESTSNTSIENLSSYHVVPFEMYQKRASKLKRF